MHIPAVLNAPRLCWVRGKPYMVRAMTLEGMGILMAWLNDVLPGRADRTAPPPIGDDESQKAIASYEGAKLLTWLALRDSGVSYAEAAGLAFHESESEERSHEHVRLLDVLLARRLTREAPTESGGDIAATWCGKGMAQFAIEYGLEATGRLSLDQYEWLMSEGEADQQAEFGNLQEIQDNWLANELPHIRAMMEAGEAQPLTP